MEIRSKSVLVVDDDTMVREAFGDYFVGRGAEVTLVSGGDEAIELLADGAHFDLIVTDIVMPDRDGIDLIRTLHKTNPEIKIVCISGGGIFDVSEYLYMAKRLGAAAVLQKPVRGADLDRVIDRL